MDPTADLPSNWGRWGENDESGTLNLISDAVRARAAAEARTGRAVSLELPIQPTPVISGPFTPAGTGAPPVQQVMAYIPPAQQAAAEMMIMTNHSPRLTHLDALSHQAIDGQVYPGRPFADSVTAAGATHASTATFASGVIVDITNPFNPGATGLAIPDDSSYAGHYNGAGRTSPGSSGHPIMASRST